MSSFIHSLTTHRWRAALAVVVLLVAVAGWWPREAGAHAFLERSDPEANAVLPDAPSIVRLWFTEPIEGDFSRAQLFDSNGNHIPTSDSQVGDERNELVLSLPAGLERGTYTIQWRNISAVDGHPQTGYLPFTIGSRADVVAVTPPAETTFTTAPTWLDATGRWLSLLGATGAIGAIVCWLWVLRASSAALPEEAGERVRERVYNLVIIAAGVGILGSFLTLAVQAANSGEGYSPSAMLSIAFDTRYGTYWLARVGLLSALVVLASADGLWDDPPSPYLMWGSLATGAAALLPFALISHAAAQPAGTRAAVAADWLHIAAASVWVGGLLALLVALVYGSRGVPSADRRAGYALAITRFTTLALGSVAVLALSGFYAGWLQVGNLTALRETDYGQALLVKLALVVPMLLLGFINQRVLAPRLRSNAKTGVHFGRTISAEVMLGIGVLFATGLVTSMAPARDAIAAESGRTAFHFTEEGIHAALYVTPGAVGQNTYTLDAVGDDGPLPQGTEVLLRISREGDVEGVREVPLQPAGNDRWEASGSELSVVGDWSLELIVRRPQTADWRATESLDVASEPPEERIPSPPPRFEGTNGAVAVLVAALAIVILIGGTRLARQPQDLLAFMGFGAALAVTGALLMVTTKLPDAQAAGETPKVPTSAESIARGQELFQANCVRCHGTEGRGDGPDAPSLALPPADLTNPHVDQHSDDDLYWWIRDGIGNNMPGFGDRLTGEQIWDLVNYVRSLRTQVQSLTTSVWS